MSSLNEKDGQEILWCRMENLTQQFLPMLKIQQILRILIFISSLSLCSFAPLDTKQFKKIHCKIAPLFPNPPISKPIRSHHYHQTRPGAPITQSTSSRWSGYASLTNLVSPLDNTVTNVFGTWVVPSIKKTKEHSYCAIWIGMDGYGSNTVEQIGTEHGWYRGKPVNYAWFEIYPGKTYQILGFPVNKNDRIGGQIQFARTSGNTTTFQMTIFNYSQCVWWTIPSKYSQAVNAKRNSAEWIVEAPSSTEKGHILPLAHFSPILFTNCQATIQGLTGGINDSHWQADRIFMKNSHGCLKAKPYKLSTDGSSFTVKWKHE